MLQKWDTGETDDWRDIVLQKFCILYYCFNIKATVLSERKKNIREIQIRKETLQVDGWVSTIKYLLTGIKFASENITFEI